jgi:hypothetical protein
MTHLRQITTRVALCASLGPRHLLFLLHLRPWVADSLTRALRLILMSARDAPRVPTSPVLSLHNDVMLLISPIRLCDMLLYHSYPRDVMREIVLAGQNNWRSTEFALRLSYSRLFLSYLFTVNEYEPNEIYLYRGISNSQLFVNFVLVLFVM